MNKYVFIVFCFVLALLLIGCEVGNEAIETNLNSETTQIGNHIDISLSEEYSPDYQTENTLNTEKFIEILKRDGYNRGDEIDKNYNTDGIERIANITPKGISDETTDIEVFLISGIHCFLMVKGVIYRFGGYHYQLCLWDYDGDGTKDLVSYQSDGSGVPYMDLIIMNMTTMKSIWVMSRMLLSEDPFSFKYEDGNIYIDGEKLIFRDGVFLCGDSALSNPDD